MKRNLLLLISATLFAGMLVLGVVPKTQGQPECSLASLNGNYGFSGTGFVQGTGVAAATVASFPNAAVGILTFDGAGGFSLESPTQSQNGTIFPRGVFGTMTGTYTVNPNCTGSAAIQTTNGQLQNGGTLSFVIAAKGTELLATFTANPFFPGFVANFVLIRMDDQTCSVASLNGSYGFIASGFFQGTGAAAASLASRPSAAAGIVTFDGAGGFSVEFTNNSNGIVFSVTGTATYAVNSDCTGFTTAVSSTAGPVDFVILAGGKKILAISTSPGSVATLVATRIR